MAASWMIRHRSLRTGRTKSKITFEDEFKLDPTCKPIENAWRLLTQLCTQSISTSRRFSLLNAFVVLYGTQAGYSAIQSIFSFEDLLTCLRISLVHECTQIRAGALRVLRRIMKTREHVQMFNDMQLPHLICRCIDIVLKNEMERIQAFQLIRRLLVLSPDTFSPILTRAMVALGMGGSEQGERLLRACLAILCEIGILNPTQLISCGGVGVILHNILECHSPRIAESLVGVLLHLLENPESRANSEVHLEMLASPYCDFQYRLGILDKNKDARDIRITCSRLALLSVLRSWAGTLQFCNPDKTSGLSSIVSVLYLNQLEVRKAVLDLLYELVGLPQPAWTDEYSVAIAALDPTDFQDQWRLNEGFVAAECRSILPTLVSTVPSPAEMHLALLLYCLLQAGILSALVEVIVASDTFISVRATILLGKLINMIHILLPHDIYNTSPTLPSLIAYASSNNPQALAAINVLENINSIMECRPVSASLFLDQILLSGNLVRTHSSQNESQGGPGVLAPSDLSHFEISSMNQDKMLRIPKKSKVFQFFTSVKEAEDLIRDSNVLFDKDGASWNWDIVRAILKSTPLNVADDTYLRFFRRLVQYFSPSCNRFSHQDLGHGKSTLHYVHAGSELVDWLIRATHPDYMRLLYDLFHDISTHVTAISKSKSAHECLFSPQHMLATLCQMYFLYIGRLCKYERGLDLLEQTNIFPEFTNILETTNHICYVKLIVTGLDYTLDARPRKILAKALNSPIIKSRLYATQFLIVLLRTKALDFVEWGLPLLIKQIQDKETGVSQVALEILTEACNEQMYLNKLMAIWPPLLSLGDPGRLLRTRLFSIPTALQRLTEEGEAATEIDHWANYYNKRYVLIVESETHCCLTQNNRNADVTYSQRVNSARNSNTLVLPTLPPHLYGQLVQSEFGLVHLSERGMIAEMVQCISQGECHSEDEILNIKACIWAVGHVASHTRGLKFLFSFCECIITNIITLAKHSYVYSVRATAFFVLGLIGSTCMGANLLRHLGWSCVRHHRNEIWPIVWTEDKNTSARSPNLSRSLSRRSPLAESKTWLRKSNTTSGISNKNNNGHLAHSSSCDCGKNDGFDASQPGSGSYSSKKNTTQSDFEAETSFAESSADKHSNFCNARMKMKSSTLSEHSLQQSFYSDFNMDEYSSIMDSSQKSDTSSSFNKNRFQNNASKSSNIMQQSMICDENILHDIGRNSAQKESGGPCYMGICLPVRLCEMFPHENSSKKTSPTNSLKDKSFTRLSDGISELALDSSSSTTDGVFIHEVSNCLLCCRSKNSKSKPSVLDKILDGIEDTDTVQEVCPMLGEDNGKLTCTILKHIQRTSNPVWYKQSKQSLLELKQSHPLAFQDICLYSEMCNGMARSTYRLNARRFLQELFLDLNFDQFYSECEYIVRNLPSLDFILRCSLSVVDGPTSSDEKASTSYSSYLGDKKLFKDKKNVFTTKADINILETNSTHKMCKTNKQDIQEYSTASTSSKSDEPQQCSVAVRTKVLNLSCTKNKFPITHRITSQNVSSSGASLPLSSNLKNNSNTS